MANYYVTLTDNLILKNTTITVSALQALITANTVVPNTVYTITNPQQGGTIQVIGTTSNTVSSNATWLRPTNLPSFGWIRLTAGSSGSVNTITVNGVNIMTAGVNYTTSLSNTATLVVANINANTGVSGWKAINILDTIVLIANTATTTLNSLTVSGTATSITLGNIQNTIGGVNSTIQSLSAIYDIASDRIRSCTDGIKNNKMSISETYRATLAFDPFDEFRWGDDAFVNCTIDDGYFRNNYFVSASSVISTYVTKRGSIESNIGSTTTSISYSSVEGDNGKILNNLLLGTSSNINRVQTRCQITGNIFTGTGATTLIGDAVLLSTSPNSGILNNTLSGNNAFIRYIFMSENTTACNISNNILSVSSAQINSIHMIGRNHTINNNTLSGNVPSISDIIMNGRAQTINNNIINGSGAACSIVTCVLLGNAASINSNTISATSTGAQIGNCILAGNGSAITNCTISGSLTSSTGIIHVKLNGLNSKLNAINFNAVTNSIVQNITIDAANASYDTITFATNQNSIQNIHWLSDDTVKMKLSSPTLTSAANLGSNNTPIHLGYLPVAKLYTTSVVFEGSGLTSSSAGTTLQIGIETDNTSAILTPTVYSTLNAIVLNNTPTTTKTGAANRRVQAIPSGGALSAGSFQIFAEFKLSKY